MNTSSLCAPAARIGTALLCLLLLAPAALAQSLTAQQQQVLAAVNSALKNTRTNLQLAVDAAGPGTGVPAGSKAKLSQMRVNQAAADLAPIGEALAGLPAGDPAVQAAAAEYDSIEQGIAALNARLAGNAVPAAAAASPAAAPAPATAPAPAAAPAAAARLSYQQEEVLKGARFNVDEVAGYAAALTQLVAELQPLPDQLGIDYRRVGTGINTIETARRKAGFAQDALNQLPPEGAGVGEVAQALAAANREVDAADAYLRPLSQQLAQQTDTASYPQYAEDLKRLSELAHMYGDPTILQTDRTRAAKVMAEAQASLTEAQRIAGVYQRLMQQQTEDGRRIEGAGNYFLEKYNAFVAAAQAEQQTLPAQVRADLAEAERIAGEAAAQRNPLLYTGGVPQAMGFAEEKLALLAVLDSAQAPGLGREVEATRTRLAESERALAELIIQQNPLPPDRYTGADRDRLIATAMDSWKQQQPDAEVLASRIPSDNWTRETMWQYSNRAWTYVDRSRLQVQLIVADTADANRAVIRPVNLWMDHQSGDRVTASPLFAADEPLQPGNYLLRSRIE